jgi:putative MFS transporter
MVTTEQLLDRYGNAPLNARYWTTFGLLSIGQALDFFDFFMVGFLMAVLGPQWHMTFGQTSVILLAAGVGAIAGALVWGTLADSWGRKKLIVYGTFICALGAAGIALVPDGNWVLFALLRFAVGFGLAGSATPTIALLVEYTPTRHRTFITSFLIVFNSVGSLSASFAAATLLSSIGWRGIAAIGIAPAILGIAIWFFVPESARWLASRGRFREARDNVAATLGVPASEIAVPTVAPPAPRPAGLRELYGDPRRFWLTLVTWTGAATALYGVYLWGPSIIALLLNISPKAAAGYFVYVSLVGVIAKILFSVLPQWLGRHRCGEIMGYGGAIALFAAGWFHSAFVFGFPAFVLLIMAGDLFFEGGLANMAPYAVEVFGVRRGARASGLAQAGNGIGKILGPICLALIAGTNNFVTPKATADAVFPAFVFLAGCSLAVGLAFSLIPIETSGKTLEQDVSEAGGRHAVGARPI